MSIEVTCRQCGAEYPVANDMAGRSIRCKECDARIHVPDDDEPDLPRRSKKRVQRSDKTPMILLIVGGVLCVGCLACSGFLVVGYWAANKVGNAVADELNQQMNVMMVPPGVGKIILSQQGVLMPNDPIRDNHLHKPVAITFQQGKTYVIDLMSNDRMDPYLLLIDPNNVTVAENDDGGGGLNSRIRFTATRSGRYIIACGALGGVQPRGSRFTVTVCEE